MSVTKQCRDANELLPAARKACNLFLEECKKAGIGIFITETYRSQARQNYLYEQGRTRSGQKVTWTRNSRHTSRLAWDIAVSPPKNLYDNATLQKAGAIAKRLGITWGGSWKGTPDMPHFEVKKDWTPPASVASEPKKEEEKPVKDNDLYKPSNQAILNSTAVVLRRLEEKEPGGIAAVHRNNLEKGTLTLSDAVGILFVGLERGLFQGNK